jgi:hypothetical protein
MIWRAIRYILMVASAIYFILFLYEFATIGPPNGRESEVVYPGAALLLLNLAYLLFGDSPKPSRISRLITLWLDAKEAELRKRSKENSN